MRPRSAASLVSAQGRLRSLGTEASPPRKGVAATQHEKRRPSPPHVRREFIAAQSRRRIWSWSVADLGAMAYVVNFDLAPELTRACVGERTVISIKPMPHTFVPSVCIPAMC